MRVIRKLLVLSAVLLLLSGSLLSPNEGVAISFHEEEPNAIESLLAQQEEDLAAYRLELQQVGEELFAEKQGELYRAQAQRLHNDAKGLQIQMEEKLQHLQDEFGGEVLRLQLQLMLVTLDEKEQQARLGEIAQVQDQMQEAQEHLQSEYEEQLQMLQAEHEERSRQETLALQNDVERAMDDEFAQYQLALLQELEEKIAKIRPTLRSEYANR